MKFTRLLGVCALILVIGSRRLNAKLSREAHTQKESAAKVKINTARSKIAKATPTTAAPVLQEINNLKKQVQADIKALAGWPSAQKRVQSALEGLDSWIPQLDKKIKQAGEQAARAAREAAREATEAAEAEARRLAAMPEPSAPPEPPTDPEAQARRRAAAASMPPPSAPPALSVSHSRTGIPPQGLGRLEPIVGFNPKIGYAEAVREFLGADSLPLENAVEVVLYNLKRESKPQDPETVARTLYEELIMPFMLENWDNDYPRGTETTLSKILNVPMTAVKTIISDPIRWAFGDLPFPNKGQFNISGLQAYQDWITHVNHNITNKDRARALLHGAIGKTKEKTSRFRGLRTGAISKEEQNARIILGAHILRAANELYPRPERGPHSVVNQPASPAALAEESLQDEEAILEVGTESVVPSPPPVQALGSRGSSARSATGRAAAARATSQAIRSRALDPGQRR